MVLSMTGYGRATKSFQDKKISMEIKTLNGKTTDLRLKLPLDYKVKEMDVRRIILNEAMRGKLDATITVEDELGSIDFGLNKKLFKKYYLELTGIMDELKIESSDMVSSILRIQNVLQSDVHELSDQEWEVFMDVVSECLISLERFRKTEGDAMKVDLEQGVKTIMDLLNQVSPHEKDRIEALRQRIMKNMENGVGKEKIDQNRFEQELLYYLEKLDINEEKVRLLQHCEYFLSELSKADKMKGRKLGFIAQEIGREINTMGSKAQFSAIQKLVVQMKDELEKIKEQLLNVL